MGRATVGLDHNVEDVIGELDGVKQELDPGIPQAVKAAMRELKQAVIVHIENDADWKGNLAASVQSHGVQYERNERMEVEISVGTDKSIAPYAPFVEFGTGDRKEETSDKAPTTWVPRKPDQYPAGYPYESPGIHRDLIDNIIEWVKTKPLVPESPHIETQEQLGLVIASVIAEKGTFAHPFLRPAWYKNKHFVKKAAKDQLRRAVS